MDMELERKDLLQAVADAVFSEEKSVTFEQRCVVPPNSDQIPLHITIVGISLHAK